MLKLLSATTQEIDDPTKAVADIVRKIDRSQLGKNSAGILFSNPDFVENGAVAELQKKLAMDIIGCSTLSGASNGVYGEEQLTLTILTSDDLQFGCALTEPLDLQNMETTIQTGYKTALSKVSAKPATIIALLPNIMAQEQKISGTHMVRELDRIVEGVPVFGTLACGITMDATDTSVFMNGVAHHSRAAMLVIAGDFTPSFLISSISSKNIRREKGKITKSTDCYLQEVNEMPLLKYMELCGIDVSVMQKAIITLPLLVEYFPGAQPVALTLYDLSPNGAMCGGEVPEGASFTFASVDRASILETAKIEMNQIARMSCDNALLFSCSSRCLTLMPDSNAEMMQVDTMLHHQRYAFAYSGGEICPIYRDDGTLKNCFHNMTCVAMIF